MFHGNGTTQPAAAAERSAASLGAWPIRSRCGAFSPSSSTNPRPIIRRISRSSRLIDVETHREVFTWVLQLLAQQGLLKGGTIAVDATTLEANAALRSIVRRDSGESYEDFLKGLAAQSGIETPTREQLAKLDKKRKNKGSN